MIRTVACRCDISQPEVPSMLCRALTTAGARLRGAFTHGERGCCNEGCTAGCAGAGPCGGARRCRPSIFPIKRYGLGAHPLRSAAPHLRAAARGALARLGDGAAAPTRRGPLPARAPQPPGAPVRSRVSPGPGPVPGRPGPNAGRGATARGRVPVVPWVLSSSTYGRGLR